MWDDLSSNCDIKGFTITNINQKSDWKAIYIFETFEDKQNKLKPVK